MKTREEPEKHLDRRYAPKSTKRRSRKGLKRYTNRAERRKINREPEHPPFPKWAGWEW